MKKYELTSETKDFMGRTLYRIRALVSFGDVRAGDLGGWVEAEKNLGQDGNAWVYGNAEVYGNARVFGDARVYGNAEVYGDARVYGNAEVYGNARVFGDARVYGNAWVDKTGAIFWIGAIGSRNDTTTFFRCKDKKIRVSCGCFFGDLDEFAEKVKETHGDNEYGRVYMLAIEMAKARIGNENKE